MERLRSAWGAASVVLALALVGAALLVPACGDDDQKASSQTVAVLELSNDAIDLRDAVGDGARDLAGADSAADRRAVAARMRSARGEAARFGADAGEQLEPSTARSELGVVAGCIAETANDLELTATSFGRPRSVPVAARAGDQFDACNVDLRVAVESVQADAPDDVSLIVDEISTGANRYRDAFDDVLAAARKGLAEREAAQARRLRRIRARVLRRALRRGRREAARERREEQLPPCSQAPPPCHT